MARLRDRIGGRIELGPGWLGTLLVVHRPGLTGDSGRVRLLLVILGADRGGPVAVGAVSAGGSGCPVVGRGPKVLKTVLQ